MTIKAAAVIECDSKKLSIQSKSKELSDGAPFKPIEQKNIEIVHKHGRLAINLVAIVCRLAENV